MNTKEKRKAELDKKAGDPKVGRLLILNGMIMVDLIDKIWAGT